MALQHLASRLHFPHFYTMMVALKGVCMPVKILLIEDEPSIAETITYKLSTEGFECTWCATGADGLAELARGAVDLIVLDVGLPDCSGFELCKTILKSYEIPIIFLTARAEEIDKVVGLEIGADDYMVKPFSPRELAARVKVVLRRAEKKAKTAPAPAPAPVTKGTTLPFAVDDDRCTITYYGEELKLSRYEYRILTVLIGRPGWVFSREKLMDMVWDVPESSMDRTVDAHIKSLRSKLRVVREEEEAIRTHRGLGYSLKEWK